MASARARFGASLALAVTATLVPAVTSAASAAPVPTVVRTVSVSTAAATTPTSTSTAAARRAALRNPLTRGRLVLAVAARYRGVPYRAGGTSPRSGFDCSGYTRYVFSRLGISIPRVSRQQYASMTHITRAQAVPGDLVFFHSGSGRVYHAAIYAGANSVWHSPFPGRRVMRERIWTSAVYFARVRVR
ncbi:MAG: C40 family peptidase [Actinomycetales bacterium]|nr:C40 family peptidase [Actinomycetales bacterium]